MGFGAADHELQHSLSEVPADQLGIGNHSFDHAPHARRVVFIPRGRDRGNGPVECGLDELSSQALICAAVAFFVGKFPTGFYPVSYGGVWRFHGGRALHRRASNATTNRLRFVVVGNQMDLKILRWFAHPCTGLRYKTGRQKKTRIRANA